MARGWSPCCLEACIGREGSLALLDVKAGLVEFADQYVVQEQETNETKENNPAIYLLGNGGAVCALQSTLSHIVERPHFSTQERHSYNPVSSSVVEVANAPTKPPR